MSHRLPWEKQPLAKPDFNTDLKVKTKFKPVKKSSIKKQRVVVP